MSETPDVAVHNESVRFKAQDLIASSSEILERLDVPTEDAREVSECLLFAEARGISSHGLIRLPVYAKRLQAGVVKSRPSIKLETRYPPTALIDGDNGLGPVVGARAMIAALNMAEAGGLGLAAVRRSNHFGSAGFYAEKAVRRGYIGFAISNAPPNMAAYGGRERFLGTNPIAIGIPAGKEDPLLFDASSSVVARGKIILAAQRNQPIPTGWAIDPQGRPTTDAREALAGAVLPFGGPKGSAISFIIDILCGVMTGAAYAHHLNTLENLNAEQNVGHVFAALRIDLFMSANDWAQRMDEILRMLKASTPAEGVTRVLAPGEIEAVTESKNRKDGISLRVDVAQELAKLATQVGAGFPPITVN